MSISCGYKEGIIVGYCKTGYVDAQKPMFLNTPLTYVKGVLVIWPRKCRVLLGFRKMYPRFSLKSFQEEKYFWNIR